MRYANMKWYSTSPKLNDGNKFFCKLYAEQKDEIEKNEDMCSHKENNNY